MTCVRSFSGRRWELQLAEAELRCTDERLQSMASLLMPAGQGPAVQLESLQADVLETQAW